MFDIDRWVEIWVTITRKQDTQLVDLLRRILGNLDVGDSIGSRKRDEERHVLEYQRIRHELRLLFLRPDQRIV